MGGLWGGQGKHSRMHGYTNDARKSIEAQLLGYKVISITPLMLKNTEGHEWSEAITLVERALGKEK